MAKVDHTFTMPEPPAQAQALFVQDISIELHQKAGLALASDEPGHVLYNDGLVDEDEDQGAGRIADPPLYSGLREITGHHVHVDFAPDGAGTRVRVHGHVEDEIRDAIDLFGQSGHWPDGARVHD